jgi:hypothetical protein
MLSPFCNLPRGSAKNAKGKRKRDIAAALHGRIGNATDKIKTTMGIANPLVPATFQCIKRAEKISQATKMVVTMSQIHRLRFGIA